MNEYRCSECQSVVSCIQCCSCYELTLLPEDDVDVEDVQETIELLLSELGLSMNEYRCSECQSVVSYDQCCSCCIGNIDNLPDDVDVDVDVQETIELSLSELGLIINLADCDYDVELTLAQESN